MDDSNNTLISSNTLSFVSLSSSTSVATHQLDCQGGWLMVHKDLNGRITTQEDLKYGESCINSSETKLHVGRIKGCEFEFLLFPTL